MQDSRSWWDTVYHDAPNRQPEAASSAAIDLASSLPTAHQILELGCGPAHDSAHLARRGHHVIASDFVPAILARDRATFATTPRLEFVAVDMRSPFPFRDNAFDVVYARLSLHYFSDEQTLRIFAEIHRVLRSGGILRFLCKTTGDPLCGQGVEVGPDMFRLDGKVRHFFRISFVRTCLAERFRLDHLWVGPEATADDARSEVVDVQATKHPRGSRHDRDTNSPSN